MDSVGVETPQEDHVEISRLRERARRSFVSPETARSDRQAVWRKRFRSDVRRWIGLYDSVGQRDGFLWQWCLHGIELTALPCIIPDWRDSLCDTKLLSVIICVLFDDIADCGERAERLSSLLHVCGQGSISADDPIIEDKNLTEHEYLYRQVVAELWGDYVSRVSQLPHFREYEPLWQFDLGQFFNAMRYGHLANRFPALLNSTEHDVYSPHNMLMVSFSTLDLMASSPLPEEELGALREAIWHSQAMGRVGNILSTWRREIKDRDYTGGIFSRALRAGKVTLDELNTLTGEEIEERIRQSGQESVLMEKWERHRKCFLESAEAVTSVDMQQLLEGHDRFFEMHLQNVGLI